MSGHQHFDDAPGDQIAQCTDDEHEQIGGLRIFLEGICEGAGKFLDDHATEAAGHGADASDGTNGFFGEHVGDGGKHVR